MTDSLLGLLRRLFSVPAIPLQPLERDFVRITVELFGFLVTEWGCRSEVTGAGSPEVAVLFRNKNVAVEVMLEDESWVIPKVIPLRNGQLPAWFDRKLRDQYTGFPPELFFEAVDPTWKRPDHSRIENAQDIENELRPYAEELQIHGEPLRIGDPDTFGQMEDAVRRRLIAIYLKDWGSFVERVRAGFDGAIAEYVAGVVTRSQLEAVLKTWKGSRNHDPVEEIQRLDRTFDESTEPLRWAAGRNVVLPSPSAKRWWRRPKWLVGSLRQYFLTYAEANDGR